jgi:hypothetical protein
VAALQHGAAGPAVAAPAFGAHDLEARVKALLDRDASAWTGSRWGLLALGGGLVFAAIAVTGAETLHHAAETVLGRIF